MERVDVKAWIEDGELTTKRRPTLSSLPDDVALDVLKKMQEMDAAAKAKELQDAGPK